MPYDYHLGYDTNNAGSEPEAVSKTVKIGVLARFVLALFEYIRKK